MNHENLFQLANLTTKSVRAFSKNSWDYYLLVSILGLGIVGNFINMLVLFSPKLKGTNYKFLLNKSITSFIYLGLTFISYLFFNQTQTQTQVSGWLKISLNYILNCKEVYRVLIELAITIRIYEKLTNRHRINKLSFVTIILISIVFSLLFYLHQPFGFTIYFDQETQKYYIRKSAWGKSKAYDIVLFIQFLFRLALVLIVLSIYTFLDAINHLKNFENGKNNVIDQTVDIEENRMYQITGNMRSYIKI